MTEIRAVISDLDDTLIHEDNANHHITIDNSVFICLEALDKQGVVMAPATGRDFFRRRWITRTLGFNGYGVFKGGAAIVDLQKERTVPEYNHRLDPEVAVQLVEQIVADTEPQFINIGKGRMPAEQIDLSDIGGDCYGIWAEVPKLHVPRFEEIVALTHGVQCHDNGGSFGAEITALHVTHEEADKGAATLHLLDLLEITPEETVVVGDSGNDLPMFEIEDLHTRIALRSRNTPERLLDAADGVVGSVHQNGFAEAMRKYVLA